MVSPKVTKFAETNLALKTLVSLLLLFSVCFTAHAYGPENTSEELTDTLLASISRKPSYASLRRQRVDSLEILLRLPRQTPARRLDLTRQIAAAFTRFDADSAIAYTLRAVEMARADGSPVPEMRERLNLANLYCKVSMFREAWEILSSIDPDRLPSPSLLPDYRYAMMNYWETYAASVPDGEKYLDYYRQKLLPAYLAVASDTTFEARTRRTCLLIDSDPAGAEQKLLRLASTEVYGSPNWGGLMYMCAICRAVAGDPQGRRKYLQLAAIADTRSANREHASLQELADLELQLGEPTDRAFVYTQTAMEDALAAGIRFRMNQMHNLYALVNRQTAEKEASERRHLVVWLSITGGLLALLLVLGVALVAYMRRLHTAHAALTASNDQLSRANSRLAGMNGQLQQLNEELEEKNSRLRSLSDMKERYIGQFFDLYSDYLAKMDKKRINFAKLLRQGRGAELQAILENSEALDSDLEALYRQFDSTFLSLYPDFVAQVNALLLPSEQIQLRPGELLNRELRLYALQRLGIADSQRVASFLRCALSTIYNYRASLRRRATGGREAFDAAIASL